MVPNSLTRRATPLEPGQPVVNALPANLVLHPHVARGWELVREIQARRCHIDRAQVPVVLVGQRGATPAAEGPAHLCRRTVLRWISGRSEERRVGKECR